MKRIILSILFLLILCVSVALAAFTKTTSIDVSDVWQEVSPVTLVAGNAESISDSYDTILYLEVAYASLNQQDGVEVSIEVSYGDDNWTLLTRPFTTPSDISDDTTLDGAVTAGDTVITMAAANEIEDIGEKWFIEDGDTDSDSESMRTKSVAGVNVTACHDAIRNHPTASNVYSVVYEYIIPIPAAYAYVRVLINNTDANADIFFTTRISKVTSLI